VNLIKSAFPDLIQDEGINVTRKKLHLYALLKINEIDKYHQFMYHDIVEIYKFHQFLIKTIRIEYLRAPSNTLGVVT
jgi:hypothetical protein